MEDQMLLEMATNATERAIEAQRVVDTAGIVISVAGVPHLNPAAKLALDYRRLALDAALGASQYRRRGFWRWKE